MAVAAEKPDAPSPVWEPDQATRAAAEELWRRTLGALEGEIDTSSLRVWFDGCRAISLVDGELTIVAPNSFAKEYIESRFGTCSPGPSRSYVATAARLPSPSGGSEKADGQDRRGGAPTGQELPAELILAYLASGCRVNRTQATAALSNSSLWASWRAATGATLCRRRQRPRALLLRTDAEVLRTAASPTPASPTGSTRPTSVPFWRRPTSCKPATKARSSEVKPSPQRRSGKRGQRAHPRYRALEKYI